MAASSLRSEKAVQIAAVCLHAFDNGGLQLANVFYAREALVAPLRLERGQIAGALQNGVVKLVERHFGDHFLQIDDHGAEFLHALARGDARAVRRGGHDLKKRYVFLQGGALSPFDAGGPDLARRLVDDPEQPCFIGRVGRARHSRCKDGPENGWCGR